MPPQANTTATAMVPVDASNYALTQMEPGEIAGIVQENLGQGGIGLFQLDRVKVPSGEMTAWTVQGLEGTEHVKALEGVIIYWEDTKDMWLKSQEDGGAKAPDCSGKQVPGAAGAGLVWLGNGDRGEHGSGPLFCDECPFNQFGSATKGEGKKCQDRRIIVLMTPGAVLPTVISLPPTSVADFKKYAMRLVGNRLKLSHVVTRLTLEPAQNKAGTKYVKAMPQFGGMLSKEDAATFTAYAEQMKPLFATVASKSVYDDDDQAMVGGDTGGAFANEEDLEDVETITIEGAATVSGDE